MKKNYQLPETLPKDIFRAYDIRGVVDEQLSEDLVYGVGAVLGSLAQESEQHSMVVGRDGRLSGPTLVEALIAGVLSTGTNVIDIGMVPTPVLYFATHTLDTQSGVMLTGSHNPVNYNGLKMLINGLSLTDEAIQKVYHRILNKEVKKGEGEYHKKSIIPDYIAHICQDIQLERPLKIVIDCGNGVAGIVAPHLFRELGCKVTELFCDVDGHFPNHHPDPSRPENLVDLIRVVDVQKADIGLAFDGDGDRLGIVTNRGKSVWPDRQMMLFAQDVLSRNPGSEILFDVKCTRFLPQIITEAGGIPLMWKTGHSLLKTKMRETGAPLAGEMSGHIFFKERWFGFDDGMYAGVRLLEILAKDTRSADEIFSQLPDSLNTPELKLAMPDARKFSFMQQFVETADFTDATVNTIDGLRADYHNGWGLIRPSNTTPNLILRFEADNEQAMLQIQDQFRQQILAIDSDLDLPF